MPNFCAQCGAKQTPTDQWCAQCGARAADATAPAPSAPSYSQMGGPAVRFSRCWAHAARGWASPPSTRRFCICTHARSHAAVSAYVRAPGSCASMVLVYRSFRVHNRFACACVCCAGPGSGRARAAWRRRRRRRRSGSRSTCRQPRGADGRRLPGPDVRPAHAAWAAAELQALRCESGLPPSLLTSLSSPTPHHKHPPFPYPRLPRPCPLPPMERNALQVLTDAPRAG